MLMDLLLQPFMQILKNLELILINQLLIKIFKPNLFFNNPSTQEIIKIKVLNSQEKFTSKINSNG